jgi:hypothetical protein
MELATVSMWLPAVRFSAARPRRTPNRQVIKTNIQHKRFGGQPSEPLVYFVQIDSVEVSQVIENNLRVSA